MLPNACLRELPVLAQHICLILAAAAAVAAAAAEQQKAFDRGKNNPY